MRITNAMLTNNFMRNVHNNLKRLENVQNNLASGTEIHRPSDDPVRVAVSLGLRSDLGELKQYISNLKAAQSWLDATDGALDNAVQVLQRARELALYGASDILPQESREALAREIDQLGAQMGLIANTDFGGRYIFGGTRTDLPPYVEGEPWKGNDQAVNYEIAPGILLPVNCNGGELFAGGGGLPDCFQVLKNLANDLRAANTDNISGTTLRELDQVLDNIIATRGGLGAKVNRVEMALSRLEQNETMYSELLANTEGTDIAKTIMDLKVQENVYRVSLATGARIIMPSLIDFLR